jgi:hypothetical protein
MCQQPLFCKGLADPLAWTASQLKLLHAAHLVVVLSLNAVNVPAAKARKARPPIEIINGCEGAAGNKVVLSGRQRAARKRRYWLHANAMMMKVMGAPAADCSSEHYAE